ncbi:MAG: hypothetical protein WDO24_29285 [Pseudomonadota bacterium]
MPAWAAACIGNVPNSALLSRWFKGRLTTAMSLLYSVGHRHPGPGAAGPAAEPGIPAGAAAYHWLGGGVFAVAVPVLLLPWRRYHAGREDLGPRGARGGIEGWTLTRAMRHPAFWGLLGVFLSTSLGMYTIVVQVVAYLVDAGFSPMEAATAWGFTGVLLPLGMLALGCSTASSAGAARCCSELCRDLVRHGAAVAARPVSQHLAAGSVSSSVSAARSARADR